MTQFEVLHYQGYEIRIDITSWDLIKLYILINVPVE